jgi:hypothetical protein
MWTVSIWLRTGTSGMTETIKEKKGRKMLRKEVKKNLKI